MFPNEVMTQPQTWNDILGVMVEVRDAPRLASVAPLRGLAMSGEEETENRTRWLRLHGPDPLERLPKGQPFLRARISAGAESRLRAERGEAPEPSPKTGAIESFETDWRKLVARDGHRPRLTSPARTTLTRRSPSPPPGRARWCCARSRSAGTPPKAGRWSAVEQARKSPNMVWYNYRRVPAVTLAKQLIDEGRLGRIFHYRAKFLQDWTISADLPQGGDGLVAARRQSRGQRRDRRPARALHRHGASG